MEQRDQTLAYKQSSSSEPTLHSVTASAHSLHQSAKRTPGPLPLLARPPVTVHSSTTIPVNGVSNPVLNRAFHEPTSLSAHFPQERARVLHLGTPPSPLNPCVNTPYHSRSPSPPCPHFFTFPSTHPFPTTSLQRNPPRSHSLPICPSHFNLTGIVQQRQATDSRPSRYLPLPGVHTYTPAANTATSRGDSPSGIRNLLPGKSNTGDSSLLPETLHQNRPSGVLKKSETVFETSSPIDPRLPHLPLQTTTAAPSECSNRTISRLPSLSELMTSQMRLQQQGWRADTSPPSSETRAHAKAHILHQMDQLPSGIFQEASNTPKMDRGVSPIHHPRHQALYGNTSPCTPLLSDHGAESVGGGTMMVMMRQAYPGSHASRERFSTSHTTHEETPSSSSSSTSTAGTIVPLGCMVMMAVLCNFDHGVIPAVLSDIQEHFDAIGYIEQSLLGSLVYVGVVSGTFLAGVSTNCMGAKWLLVASLLAASAALYGFSCATSLAVMYTARFFVGFCQALPVVYLPVWVDSFAPEGKKTRWMAYSQLGSIGGSVIGYFLGGILSRVHGDTTGTGLGTSWRTPFQIQAIAMLPVVVVLACLPTSAINVPYHTLLTTGGRWPEDSQRQGSPVQQPPASPSDLFSTRFWNIMTRLASGAKSLLRNPLYVVITLGMSILYFVVTGIQFWVTEYMVVVLKFNKMTVVVLSSLCFLTAPTSGVWCGGCICDLCGGYRQQRTAVRVATLFAGLSSILAVASAYVTNLFLFAVLLWGCLFAGGALVPVAVGILLSSVPFQQRSLSSAISQFSYNVLGWFAAPIVSGAVMDTISTWQAEHLISFQGKELPLSVGFTMILCASFIGFIFFAIANLLTLLPAEEVEKEELEFGLARSRMPTLSF
ncbi:major facilitator family protein [Cystoisospora suis]|uniref:Major facilitator family protein n=1 Tax=Cystoisospora suis TaxID=483139 RepID=A0A2C6L5L8_9APIC|nr:major facilitator family protein [Cystoisospora suis]